MTWFKLYCEFATDPKVQSMTEPMQRRLVLIFCLTASGDLKKLTTEELCLAMRISERELEKTKELFIRKGFIDDAWSLRNWEKRQAPADPTAAERMRRLRERQRNAERNVTRNVTAPLRVDTETEVETEGEGEKNPPLPPPIASLGSEYTQLGEYAIQLGADVSWGTWTTRMGLSGHSVQDIRAALDQAAGSNKLTQPYVASILRGWAVEGRPKSSGWGGRAPSKPPPPPVDPEKLKAVPIRINDRMSPKTRRISIEQNRANGFPDDGVIAS